MNLQRKRVAIKAKKKRFPRGRGGESKRKKVVISRHHRKEKTVQRR